MKTNHSTMSTTFNTDPRYVMLLSTMALDGKPLGEIFGRLIENDIYISENFTNVIGIWQCNWYYDRNEHGYPKGHLCWLNTEEPLAFIKRNYDIIQEYTDLRSIIINKLPDFDPTDEDVISAYYSAMTGYVDPANGIVYPLEPILDIGDYSKGPQLVVSLKDDNKDLVTETSAWKKLFVEMDEGTERIRTIIDGFMRDVLSTHLMEYHLSGHEDEIIESLSNYVDEFEEKKSITELDGLEDKFYMDFNNRNAKNVGVDYVVDYVRKPYRLSGVVSEYQAIRRWHSGTIEHFGTISKTNPLFRLSDWFVIPFNWKYTETGGTRAYEYGGVSEYLSGMLSVVETENDQISPLDNFINATYAHGDYSIDGKNYAIPFADDSYSIVVSPVFQNLSGITENFIEPKFGTDAVELNWNNNFALNTINGDMKTREYCAIYLADTRIVSPYISYYAVGKGKI